jgi:type IV pilus assembly protein PilA
MLTRIRKSMDEKDSGFTLIELLVVMIIIGILAAIAIPVFLSQRKKAQDSAAKADISTIGKEVATYYVDGVGSSTSGAMAVTNVSGRYVLNVTAAAGPPAVDAVSAQDLGKASASNVLQAQTFVDDTHWCVSISNSKGDKAKLNGTTGGYKYSAKGGLDTGLCVAGDVA